MKGRIFCTTAQALLLVCGTDLFAQCRGGNCAGGLDPWPALAPTVEVYSWQRYPDNDPDQVALFAGGRQVGAWSWKEGRYYPYDAALRRFGQPQDRAPVEPPADPAPERRRHALVQQLPTGVEWDKVGLPDSPMYRINGRPCSKLEAYRAIENGLTDDSKLPWLVLVGGTEQERKAVIQDLETHPALEHLKGKIRVQSYPADHWAVKLWGFKSAGRPVIYFQAATGQQLGWTDVINKTTGKKERVPLLAKGGEVLHRQDDYEGGPQALAEALRKADPAYRPENDPDRRKPDPILPGVPQLSEETIIGVGAAALVAVAVGASIRKRREQ